MVRKNHGTVIKGKFVPDNVQEFKSSFFVHEGKQVVVTVDRKKKSRSTNQNSYYHGVVVKLVAEVTGYTHDEAHDALRWQFLKIRRTGMPDTVRSTASLSTVEFEQYAADIRQWASLTLDCFIPEPNEVEWT